MEDFKKIVCIGELHPKWATNGFFIFCEIGFKDGRLSISGVEGPLHNGDARGSWGQINLHEWEIVKYARAITPCVASVLAHFAFARSASRIQTRHTPLRNKVNQLVERRRSSRGIFVQALPGLRI